MKTVNRVNFLDWVLEDAEDFYANKDWIIDHLKRFGSVTDNDLFSHCGYVPSRLILENDVNSDDEFTPDVDCKLQSLERPKDYTDKQTRLRNILIKYGSEEFGDCILDEICELFNHRLTPEE
jgi:hypothetical protein